MRTTKLISTPKQDFRPKHPSQPLSEPSSYLSIEQARDNPYMNHLAYPKSQANL